MIRAAAVRMYFPSPSGFGGICETGKVIDGVGVWVAENDGEVYDMIR